MQVRRVVTGHTPEGKAVVVSDGPAPRTHDFVHIPSMASTMLWATKPGEPVSGDGGDPTAAVRSQVPEPGGTCFVIVNFPPDSVYADPGFDPVAADAEGRLVTPGIVDQFEPDNPGMHWTPTVDYQLVLDGELWLELDDGALTHLRPGDVVIQNGTRHGWRNHTDRPATLLVVHVGAERVAPPA